MAITIIFDTCIWLELLKADMDAPDNLFEEVMFWIEEGHLTCLTTENMMREWNRNRESKKKEIIKVFKDTLLRIANSVRPNSTLSALYEPSSVEVAVEQRCQRLEAAFNFRFLIARENDVIYKEAVTRNLATLAPSHSKDSFRDTLNIVSIFHYLKNSPLTPCFFSTINHKDFSQDAQHKYQLHTQLTADFASCGLQYAYFEDTASNYGGELIKKNLRPNLPSFANHLKQKKDEQEAEKLRLMKQEKEIEYDAAAPDYLKNLPWFEMLLSKPESQRTGLDIKMINLFLDEHPAYQAHMIKFLARL